MPRCFARCFKASSSDCGTRILIWAAFGSNSKRTGTISEKSYSVRSASWTKRSASSSLRKTGHFFFIAFNLLPVHVTGADRSDVYGPAAFPVSEDHEHVAVGRRPPGDDVLDLGPAYAVSAAFRPVPLV